MSSFCLFSHVNIAFSEAKDFFYRYLSSIRGSACVYPRCLYLLLSNLKQANDGFRCNIREDWIAFWTTDTAALKALYIISIYRVHPY